MSFAPLCDESKAPDPRLGKPATFVGTIVDSDALLALRELWHELLPRYERLPTNLNKIVAVQGKMPGLIRSLGELGKWVT